MSTSDNHLRHRPAGGGITPFKRLLLLGPGGRLQRSFAWGLDDLPTGKWLVRGTGLDEGYFAHRVDITRFESEHNAYELCSPRATAPAQALYEMGREPLDGLVLLCEALDPPDPILQRLAGTARQAGIHAVCLFVHCPPGLLATPGDKAFLEENVQALRRAFSTGGTGQGIPWVSGNAAQMSLKSPDHIARLATEHATRFLALLDAQHPQQPEDAPLRECHTLHAALGVPDIPEIQGDGLFRPATGFMPVMVRAGHQLAKAELRLEGAALCPRGGCCSAAIRLSTPTLLPPAAGVSVFHPNHSTKSATGHLLAQGLVVAAE